MPDSSYKVYIEYDEHGNIIGSIQFDGNDILRYSYVYDHEYDELGRIIKKTDYHSYGNVSRTETLFEYTDDVVTREYSICYDTDICLTAVIQRKTLNMIHAED